MMNKIIASIFALVLMAGTAFSQSYQNRRPYAVELDQLVGVTNLIQSQLNASVLKNNPVFTYYVATTNLTIDPSLSNVTNAIVFLSNAGFHANLGIPDVGDVPTGTKLTVYTLNSTTGIVYTASGDPVIGGANFPTSAAAVFMVSNSVHDLIYGTTNVFVISH